MKMLYASGRNPGRELYTIPDAMGFMAVFIRSASTSC
jgi:hypothetical protein